MAQAGFHCVHAHSSHSRLDGTASPEELLERAHGLGYASLALTDTNTLGGAVEFLAAARRFPGLRPLVGARLRVGPHKATAIIADSTGWASLSRVISRIHLDGKVGLVPHLKANDVGIHVLIDDPTLLAPLRDVYKDRLWVELLRPRPEQKERELLTAAERLGVKPVASLGAILAAPEDLDTHKLLSAVRLGVSLDKVDPKGGVSPNHSLCDREEVQARFLDIPDAVVNAATLAESCHSDVLPRGRVMPPADCEQGQDADGYLRLLCERAIPEKAKLADPAVRARLDHELAIISRRGLASFFLVAARVVTCARSLGVPTMLRGSAGASFTLYLLGVGELNPLEHEGLRFERFLHPGREDWPDIDIEVESEGRSRVVNALAERFGKDRLAVVGVVNHYQAPGAFRAAAHAHGLTGPALPDLLEELGERPGLLVGPPVAPMDGWPFEPEKWHPFLADAGKLVGRPYELTTHRSAIVLTPGPIEGHVPVERRAGALALCQLDGDGVEAVGLLPLDILHSHALAVLSAASSNALVVDNKAQAQPPPGDSDAGTLSLLAKADTLGVAQLETPTLRRLLVQAAPKSLADLAAVVAAARPGAYFTRETYLRRRRGVERTTYPHPDLELLLRGVHGALLYEDDALGVLELYTGWPASECDRIRRLLLDKEEAGRATETLHAAAAARKIPGPAVQWAVEQLKSFAKHGFCRAHALALASLAWRECWAKAHNPLAFWVAVANHHGGRYPLWVLTEEMKRAGLVVHSACVNASKDFWSVEAEGPRPGLASVIGEETRTRIIEERVARGPYLTLRDFRQRLVGIDSALIPLIRSGALDCTGLGRRSLLRAVNMDPDTPMRVRRNVTPWPFESPPPGFPLARQWSDAWHTLGFLAGPPLMRLVRPSLPSDLADSRTLLESAGETVRIAGFVALTKKVTNDRGDVLYLTLQDEFGLTEARYDLDGPEPDTSIGPVLVTGRVEEQHGAPVLWATRIERVVVGEPRKPQLRLVSEAS